MTTTNDSSLGFVDELVGRLPAAETTWARTSLTQRAELLGRFAALVDQHAEQWALTGARIKGIPADSEMMGEEWIGGPWAILAYVEALKSTLEVLAAGGDPLEKVAMSPAPGGRIALQVLPHTTFDKLLLNGFRAEVWTEPGVTAAELRDRVGLTQREPHVTFGSCFVLGAGNVTSCAPSDVLYQLFAENRVVVLKLNPVMDAVKPVFDAVFAPFIELGVVQIVTGGVDVGEALAHHPGISAVHMTGSEATHDAVVWGVGDEGKIAKATGQPRLGKPMTSELGGVSPVIVVPGEWSKADLRFQARHIATLRLQNSGSNCVAAQVVILSSDWSQKEEFLGELRAAMKAAPKRIPWYPGTEKRVQDARTSYPAAEAIGGTPERTLITGLNLDDPGEPAFHCEYFGPVLGVAELPGTGQQFLDRAVAVSNERLHGTLGANILIHPKTRRALGDSLLRAITALRYGTISINCWTGVGYLSPTAPWGAFPGHRLDDIQSGIGVIHNALLLPATERTIVSGPFRPFPRSVLHGEMALAPTPPWFIDHRNAAKTARKLASFAAKPRWRALPGIVAAAMRG
ncbi:aldehyde dehydrogenase family protein [Saccharopolyspora shandongensis]|uniref:aldehyde dehydrogenase family protein n=1 Tax=Saccharopolyspora shandongensis TaxID=418495 RepID=UPI0033DFA28D